MLIKMDSLDKRAESAAVSESLVGFIVTKNKTAKSKRQIETVYRENNWTDVHEPEQQNVFSDKDD